MMTKAPTETTLDIETGDTESLSGTTTAEGGNVADCHLGSLSSAELFRGSQRAGQRFSWF
jgi:hypothetical protein